MWDAYITGSVDLDESNALSEGILNGGLMLEDESPMRTDYSAKIPEMYGLGLILLELGRGMPLRDSALGKHPPPGLSESMREYLMACKYLAAVGRDMGAAYERAVRVCLYCDVGTGRDGLQGMQAKNMIWQKVVAPLHTCLQQFD